MSLTRHTARRRGAALVATLACMGLLGACVQESASDTPSGRSEDSQAGIAQAEKALAGWSAPLTTYPEEPALSATPDMAGKNVMVIPLGDQIPVIHGVAVGIEDAMKSVGATTQICDGKFNPTAVADCLKQAGDQGADAVVTLFVDYAMAGNAFDALADSGVPVLIGGVAPTRRPRRPTRRWRSTTTPPGSTSSTRRCRCPRSPARARTPTSSGSG